MSKSSSSKPLLREKVLGLLLRDGQLTRQQLLQELPGRPASLLEVINDLTRRRIVYEPQRSGRRTGRKASPISLDPAAGLFVGLELDSHQVTGLCVDAQGQVLARCRMESVINFDVATARRQVEAVLADLQTTLGPRWSELRGVAMADPGLVDTTTGTSIKAVNVPGWERLPTGPWLQELTGCASHVLPAPLSRAWAEFVAMGSPVNTSLFHLQIDEGIGGGFIKDGRFFLGDRFAAMEVGHVVVRENGPLCRCGNRGCLEAVAGLDGLRKQVADLARHRVISDLTNSDFSMRQLLGCVEGGDKVAGSLVADACEAMGIALASVLCILNPGVIVLSGALTGLGPRLLDGVQRVLSRRCLPQALTGLSLRLSSLGDEGTALGAALVAREEGLRRALAEAGPANG